MRVRTAAAHDEPAPTPAAPVRSWRRRWHRDAVVAVVVSFAAALLLLWATRADPQLSPDSIAYLAAADNIRHLDGVTDFTGEPLTVFPPVYPMLLAPGGASLGWARVVGALSVAVLAWSMWAVLRVRVSSRFAVAGAALVGGSAIVVRVAATVWSEAPYMAISMLTLAVLAHRSGRTGAAPIAGALAGLGFLTRYAGATLVMSAGVVVCLAAWDRNRPRRLFVQAAAFASAALAIIGAWLARNWIVTGQPLGPRFEGGAPDSWAQLRGQAYDALGHVAAGTGLGDDTTLMVGRCVVGAVAMALAIAVVRAISDARRLDRMSPRRIIDLGVALYGAGAIVMPVYTRTISANDIEYRVMSPTIITLVYFAVVGTQYLYRLATTSDTGSRSQGARAGVAVVGVALVIGWVSRGVGVATDFPDATALGAGNRYEFSAPLHDAIDALPGDTRVLTNSPQRVYWHNRRQPTLFAFTRPRPGNSHYPLSAAETLAEACSGQAVLAWFSGLRNAGDGPDERRPDITALVMLTPRLVVAGGTLYDLAPIDPASCAP